MALLCCVGALTGSFSASSQDLTHGTLTLLVPYPAGGVSDVLARAMAPALARTMQRTVIVENLSGASGSIAATRFLSGTSDSRQLLVGSPTETILAPLTIPSLRYRAADFRLLGLLYSAPLALYARPDLAADSVDALAAPEPRAGAAPLTYGSPGPGSLYHVMTENLRQRLGVQATHIPYKGGAPLLQDLMAGTIDFTMLPVDNLLGTLVRSGKIKVLGVTSAQRTARFPEAAALDESVRARGFGHPTVWVGLFAGSSMPTALSADLHRAVMQALAAPDTRQALEAAGGTVPAVLDRAQADRFYAREAATLGDMALAAKVQAN